jgi:mannosyltransferase OCH1-like enzyme
MGKFFFKKNSIFFKRLNAYKKKLFEIMKIKLFNSSFVFSKNAYNSVIPCNIYQTWQTKVLPEKMRLRVEQLKQMNPKFRHYLFDDDDCKDFIKKNFEKDVFMAYNALVPGAYKADLWRYCVLYKNGGIYLDIKFGCINNFRLIELTEAEHFVKDRWNCGIYNALMVCKPGNELMRYAINNVVENVKNNFYGESSLHPTGPALLRDIINKNQLSNINIDMLHEECGGFIRYKKKFVISTTYPEYDSERNEEYTKQNKSRYDKIWDERRIYKNK